VLLSGCRWSGFPAAKLEPDWAEILSLKTNRTTNQTKRKIMKKIRTPKLYGVALAALLLGSASLAFAQTTNFYVDTFDTAASVSGANGVANWYGTSGSGGVYDPNFDNTGNGGGSLYIIANITSAGDTPFTEYVTVTNWGFLGVNPWYYNNVITNSFNLAAYANIQFDILWDTAYSTISIDQFNNLTNLQASLAGSYLGLDIEVYCATPADLLLTTTFTNTIITTNTGPPVTYTTNYTYTTIQEGGGTPAWMDLVMTNIPDAAANGWVHMTIPINPLTPGIGYCEGVMFKKWVNHNATLVGGPYQADFWIDNIMVGGSPNPLPPVIIQNNLVKATKGLNVIASTSGINDRQFVELVQSTNLSWVGHATGANPVTYSFTINGFPTNAADNNHLYAFLFLVPNPAQDDAAPDWTEPAMVSVAVESNTNNPPNSGYMTFGYKVNDPNDNGMTYGHPPYTNAPGSNMPGLESGALATLNSSNVLGTWIIKFTSDSNFSLTAPDGSTTNVVFPAYNTQYFREGYVAAPKPFSVYLGEQPNNSACIGADVCYSWFAITNSALSPGTYISDNFLADSTLNVGVRGMLGYGKAVWQTTLTAAPAGVFITPTNAAYWITWSAPASGYSLQIASALTGPWVPDTTDFSLNGYGQISELVTTNNIPAGPVAFFRLLGPK
jgi:hypothetical protein